MDTAKPDGDVDEIYLSSPPSHLGAEVSVRTPGLSSSLRSPCLRTLACSPLTQACGIKSAAAEESAAKSAAAKVSAAAEAVAEEATIAEAPVAEEVVAEEAAKEVEKPAKTVSNTPDPTVSAPQRSLLALLAFHPPVLISLPCTPQEWADRSMVVEDSFYASKPVFLTSVEIGLAEPRAAKIMQRVSRGLLAPKKVAVMEEDAAEGTAAEA